MTHWTVRKLLSKTYQEIRSHTLTYERRFAAVFLVVVSLLILGDNGVAADGRKHRANLWLMSDGEKRASLHYEAGGSPKFPTYNKIKSFRARSRHFFVFPAGHDA